jgi:hypothetical protein
MPALTTNMVARMQGILPTTCCLWREACICRPRLAAHLTGGPAFAVKGAVNFFAPMKNAHLFVLLLSLPLAAHAQTKTTAPAKTSAPAATAKPGAEQQVTEVTEDLDPATGKVIRRTTRTTTVPAGTPTGTAARPGTTVINPSTSSTAAPTVASGVASDTAVSDFFRERMTVGRLTAPQLLDTYTRFLDKVREDRRTWTPADWARAANVLSALNARYEQVRSTYTLDDKLTIRGVQGEFQALRTAKQLSGTVSDKL